MPGVQVRNNNAWITPDRVFVNNNGWTQARQVWMNNAGTWVRTYPPTWDTFQYTLVGGGGGANGSWSGTYNPVSGGGAAVANGTLTTAELRAWIGKSLTVQIGGGGGFPSTNNTAGGTGGTTQITGTGITTISAAGGAGAAATTKTGGASGNGNPGAVSGGGGAGAGANAHVGGTGVASIINGVTYGTGGSYRATGPVSAAANTGNGGGGGALGTRAGSGGSGIVILSYEAGSAGWLQFTYSGTMTTDRNRGGKWITHTITDTGTLTPIVTRT